MESVDVTFEVPFVHRLRFTRDVLGTDSPVLTDLLQPPPGQPRPEQPPPGQPLPRKGARVQFWADQQVLAARPDLKQRIHRLVAGQQGAIVQVGNVQAVPGGEEIKNDTHIIERMLKVLHAADLDRQSYIVVIGGGAVLDAVGFAVSVAHRGLRLIRIPTTTLAQADSAIGVKNAVNLFQKKNWIGTFAVPWGVINDSTLLETLSDRDFRCGFAEAVKVALLKDRHFFHHIARHASDVAQRDFEHTIPIIGRSAHWHLRHITQGGDPFEAQEARPLDFGHWSAHKLESLSDYSLRHGEAVAIGLAIDTVYSCMQHGLPVDEMHAVLKCLRDLGFDLNHPMLDNFGHLFAGLEEFRQHLGGRLTLTMLRAIGDPIDVHDVDRPAMESAVRHLMSSSPSTR